MSEVIKSYKGFDKDLKCRDFQYEIGKEYEEPKAIACNAGFHACEVPLDVFNHYPPANSRFCEVEQSGDFSRDGDDSKVASTKIKIGAEIGIPGLVKAQIEYVKRVCENAPEKIAQGYRGHAAAQGNEGHAAAQGNWGHAAAQGDRGHAAAQGNWGHAEVKGKNAIAAAFGIGGRAKGSDLTDWIVLAEYDDDCNLVCVKTAKVDGEKIKADTWYTLRNGEIVKTE